MMRTRIESNPRLLNLKNKEGQKNPQVHGYVAEEVEPEDPDDNSYSLSRIETNSMERLSKN